MWISYFMKVSVGQQLASCLLSSTNSDLSRTRTFHTAPPLPYFHHTSVLCKTVCQSCSGEGHQVKYQSSVTKSQGTFPSTTQSNPMFPGLITMWGSRNSFRSCLPHNTTARCVCHITIFIVIRSYTAFGICIMLYDIRCLLVNS